MSWRQRPIAWIVGCWEQAEVAHEQTEATAIKSTFLTLAQTQLARLNLLHSAFGTEASLHSSVSQ